MAWEILPVDRKIISLRFMIRTIPVYLLVGPDTSKLELTQARRPKCWILQAAVSPTPHG